MSPESAEELHAKLRAYAARAGQSTGMRQRQALGQARRLAVALDLDVVSLSAAVGVKMARMITQRVERERQQRDRDRLRGTG